MNITEQELKQLENAPNGIEWNKIVKAIKEERNGTYPPDWFAKVISSNLKCKVNLSISLKTTSILESPVYLSNQHGFSLGNIPLAEAIQRTKTGEFEIVDNHHVKVNQVDQKNFTRQQIEKFLVDKNQEIK